MKLTYYKGDVPNFGDDLNDWMWKRILPEGVLDDDERELFLGIGSILTSGHPHDVMKYVFGSGYGGYGKPPNVDDGNWDVRFVRGPKTARIMGVPESAVVSDSAILLRAVKDLPDPSNDIDIAVMPHFQSLEHGSWEQLCKKAGFTLIDPRDDVELVLSQIRGASLVITEAMHGAIVSDALRTPWVALKPINSSHHMKWSDWAESLGLTINAYKMLPTSAMELFIYLTEGRKYYDGKAKSIFSNRIFKVMSPFLLARSVRNLKKVSNMQPQLSEQTVIEAKTLEALSVIEKFVDERLNMTAG